MTKENLITLINEVGLTTVIQWSFGESMPYTSLEIIKIYQDYKHQENGGNKV